MHEMLLNKMSKDWGELEVMVQFQREICSSNREKEDLKYFAAQETKEKMLRTLICRTGEKTRLTKMG